MKDGGVMGAPGYEILERIGGTDGADVFVAHQKALGRRVALKVLRGDLSGDEQRARFEFETRTASQLMHPHIVPLLDSGMTADGHRYYAMPHLTGGDLSHRIPLPPGEVRRIALALCEALWYAHGRNVVHRDIKPANVLFDENDRPMLSDFGIATSIFGRRGLTLPGRALGSARYISPEQARGEKVDPRADLYSLAVVVFEMLTGRAPYDGGDDVAIATQHANAPLPTLPAPFAAWQAFFDRALAKAPAERFMSARTMAQALELIPLDAAVAAGSASVAAVAVPLAGALPESASDLVDDDLPRIRAEAPSYRETPRPAQRTAAARYAAGAFAAGALAIAALVAFLVTRDPAASFEPVVVTATPPQEAPAATPPVAEAPAPMKAPQVAPPPAAKPPAPAKSPARPVASRGAAKPAPAPPAAAARSKPEVEAAPRLEADEPVARYDVEPLAREDALDDRYADERGQESFPAEDERGRYGDDTERYDERGGPDAGYDERAGPYGDDARYGDDRDPIAREPSDYRDDPALAPGNWSPPIGRLDLSGPPRRQIAALDAHVDAARAWIEDERWRIEQLATRMTRREAEQEFEEFEAQEQAFERWLDRMSGLRMRLSQGY